LPAAPHGIEELILYITLGCCAAIAAWLVYRRDLYEREPLPLLVLTVALGAAAMWLAGTAEDWTFRLSGITGAYPIAAIAAIEEELMRVLVVLAVIVGARRHFNDPLDGIIYGSMAGLGMAVEESIQYLRELPTGTLYLPPAELVRVSGHLVMGGIGAFGLGPAILGWKRWPLILTASFGVALGLHFGWDWIVLSAPDQTPGTREAWAGTALMISGMLVYSALIMIASNRSRMLFSPSNPPLLWGWPFVRRAK
jgi:RsiW-degrading membrane proteinase PrsW (M82 family)